MSVPRIVLRLSGGNFARVWVNDLDGGLDGGQVVHVRGGELPAARGLRQSIALTIHRQNVDVVGQPVEESAGPQDRNLLYLRSCIRRWR